MSTVVKNESENPTPAPAGLHQAVCVDVADLGLQETKFGKKRMVKIWWQIGEVNPDTGKRFTISRRYSASLHPKATLAKDLAAWRGKPLSKEEQQGFDLEVLVGKNCQVQVIQEPGDDGTVWANIQTIVPIRADMERMRPLDYVRLKDRPQQDTSKGEPWEKATAPASQAAEF